MSNIWYWILTAFSAWIIYDFISGLVEGYIRKRKELKKK